MHHRRRHRLALIALSLTAFLAVAGSAATVGKQEIVYNMADEPITLDPTYAYDLSSLTVALNLFEGLLRFDNTHRRCPAWRNPGRFPRTG